MPRTVEVPDHEVAGGADDTGGPPPVPGYGRTFWVGLVVGGAVMAYGIWGAATAFSAEERRALATWVVGSALAHDVVLAPFVTVVGLALAWALPRAVRGPVLGALAISALVLLFSWPALRGFGRHEANPSVLPHDYGRNVTIVLALVWASAAAIVAVRAARGRRR